MSTQNQPQLERSSLAQDTDSVNAHIFEVLELLDQEAGKVQRPTALLEWKQILAMIAVGVFIAVTLRFLFGFNEWLASGIGIAILPIYVFSWCIVRRFEMNMRASLPSTSIIDLIALGPQELVKIFYYTPWPWSLAILGLKPRNLKGWIRLLARNLDWYIEEPKLLLRPTTIAAVLIWSLYIVYTLSFLIMPSLVPSHQTSIAVTYMVTLPAAMLWGVSIQKRMLSAMLLRDCLRERLADEEDEAKS